MMFFWKVFNGWDGIIMLLIYGIYGLKNFKSFMDEGYW